MTEPDLQRRFGGLDRLFGAAAAAHIRASHVAVVGIGGVGSWSAEALARSGVGRLTLIVMDHIAESNINRQIHALEPSLGQAKVLAMRDRIALINPACEVTCIEEFVEPENWPDLLPPGVTAVIDACDQVKAKLAMAVWARRSNVLFITVGAAGGKRHAHLVDIDDLARITHDPLLAQLRYRLRKQQGATVTGKKMGTTGVFSREPVRPAAAECATPSDGSLNCHGYGSSVGVTASFGFCAASWVLDQIAAQVSV
jgi:tRNA A37 threonylcarbamoyladenosine dehydratase